MSVTLSGQDAQIRANEKDRKLFEIGTIENCRILTKLRQMAASQLLSLRPYSVRQK